MLIEDRGFAEDRTRRWWRDNGQGTTKNKRHAHEWNIQDAFDRFAGWGDFGSDVTLHVI